MVSVDLLLIAGLLYYARFGREWSLRFELPIRPLCKSLNLRARRDYSALRASPLA